MKEAEVQLIIPTPLIDKFPTSVRPHLETVDRFIADMQGLNIDDSSEKCGQTASGKYCTHSARRAGWKHGR